MILVANNNQRRFSLIGVLGVFLFASIGMFFVAAILQPRTVSAQGSTGGSGGTGGGGCASQKRPSSWHCAKFGAGWYMYPISSSGPAAGFKNGESWSSIVSRCQAVGADTVITYIISNGYLDGRRKWRGYDFGSVNGTTNDQAGNGRPWLSNNDAKSRFDNRLGGSSGLVWGDNVGWFCYSEANWSITPRVTLNGGSLTYLEVGATTTVAPSVNKAGPTKTSNVTWQLLRYRTTSNQTSWGASGSPFCTQYSSSVQDCTLVSSGARTFSDSRTALNEQQYIVQDLPAGTRVCFVLSGSPQSHSSTLWVHSTPACLIVAKKPNIQIKGSDLIVGRGVSQVSNVETSTKVLGGSAYGSWAEYAMRVSGRVTGMASGSGYAGSSGGSITSLCGVSILTFANRPNGSGVCSNASVGMYGGMPANHTIASRFPTSSATQIAGNQSLGSFANRGVYTNNAAGSTINITAAPGETVPAGKWFVINAPNATVRIMNNIIYTGAALTSLADIPQVVIIAKNIIIADSVSQVDAWLIATGAEPNGIINTCGAGGVNETTTLTSSVCGTKLTVNGPVIANHLLLRRTAGAGAGTASGDPAEVFNLRPDAYLWATALQAAGAKAKTVITTELPPRY